MSAARPLDAAPTGGVFPLQRLSAGLARLETGAAGLMAAATLAITAAAALARYFGAPLVWADEAAIATMTWGAFLGASALFATRGHMAMELLPDLLGPTGRRRLARLSDLIVLAAFAGLGWLLWRWFDLPGLIRAGSAEAMAQETFNFIWLEPTQTLGIRKIWIWLVLPLFTLGGTVHTLAHLAARS
ncbi:TRAP transporter small permease [Paenirhodobacter sp.]|uniref:TRAP transporter small permease n=1 Tax=Paenirhodobacter sp. TaxID=1965326 RepID=UPI003B40781B